MAESTKFGQIRFVWQIMDENSRQHAAEKCLRQIGEFKEGSLTEFDGQFVFCEKRMN